MRNSYKDRIIINHFGPIKNDQIISINYDISFDYSSQSSKQKNKAYTTAVDYVENIQSLGPMFNTEEKEEVAKQTAEKEQSFFSKYVMIHYIILVVDDNDYDSIYDDERRWTRGRSRSTTIRIIKQI